jgi:hypothetical protein
MANTPQAKRNLSTKESEVAQAIKRLMLIAGAVEVPITIELPPYGDPQRAKLARECLKAQTMIRQQLEGLSRKFSG